jgi:uncharacterized protein (UPF0333 family)
MKSSNVRLFGVYAMIIIIVSMFMFSCESPSKRNARAIAANAAAAEAKASSNVLGVTVVVGTDKLIGASSNKKFFVTAAGDTVGVWNKNVKEIRKITLDRHTGDTRRNVIAYEIIY